MYDIKKDVEIIDGLIEKYFPDSTDKATLKIFALDVYRSGMIRGHKIYTS